MSMRAAQDVESPSKQAVARLSQAQASPEAVESSAQLAWSHSIISSKSSTCAEAEKLETKKDRSNIELKIAWSDICLTIVFMNQFLGRFDEITKRVVQTLVRNKKNYLPAKNQLLAIERLLCWLLTLNCTT